MISGWMGLLHQIPMGRLSITSGISLIPMARILAMMGQIVSQATHTVTADKLGEYRIEFQVIDNNDANPFVGANFYVGADNPNFNAAPTLIYKISPK